MIIGELVLHVRANPPFSTLGGILRLVRLIPLTPLTVMVIICDTGTVIVLFPWSAFCGSFACLAGARSARPARSDAALPSHFHFFGGSKLRRQGQSPTRTSGHGKRKGLPEAGLKALRPASGRTRVGAGPDCTNPHSCGQAILAPTTPVGQPAGYSALVEPFLQHLLAARLPVLASLEPGSGLKVICSGAGAWHSGTSRRPTPSHKTLLSLGTTRGPRVRHL